jgi:voltage-gated potassium channel
MNLKKTLLKFAYELEAKKGYKKIKSKVDEILNDPSSVYKSYFDYFMIFLVLSTILILILEIKHELPWWVYAYESFAVVIFIIEWLGRVWVSSDFHIDVIESYESLELKNINSTFWMLVKPALLNKLRFITTPMSIIDLLAILPSYRPLRVFRFFLLFRLFKVFRYTQNANFFLKVFKEKRFEFLTLIVIFAFMVFFASTVIYIFEGGGANKKIDTFFDAIYWAVITITTVGFGDITPQTNEGKFVTIFLIIGGIAIISFMTSIITTSMTEKLEEVKSLHVINEISKLKHYILVCGYGKMGKVLCEELDRSNESFVVIDPVEFEVEEATKKGFLALKADASDMEILKEIKCDSKLKYGVALTNDDALNLSIVLSLKALNPNVEVFSRLNDIELAKNLEIAGAKEEIFPYKVAARAAYKYFRQPVAFSAVDNILLERYDPIIDEIEIINESFANGKSISKIGVKKHNLKVMGVIRCSEEAKLYFNPNIEEFKLKEHDVLVVIGDSVDIASFKIELLRA